MTYITPQITPQELESYAFTNGSLLKGEPRAVILIFHGLGGGALRSECDDFEVRCAAENVLTVYPYYGPWSWMNRQSVWYVDEIMDAVREKYLLDESVPVISSGGSMGGLSALMYTTYAAVTPTACFANCPVCDLPFHATERPDLPRTVYLAFAYQEQGLEQALVDNSPYHQAAKMPRIPYFVVHGDADTAVNKALHSDRFVAAMRAAGQEITYREVAGMAHCDLKSFPEEKEIYESAMLALCRQ